MALLYTALFQVCFNLALLPGEGENLAKERIHGPIVQRRLPRASQLNFGKHFITVCLSGGQEWKTWSFHEKHQLLMFSLIYTFKMSTEVCLALSTNLNSDTSGCGEMFLSQNCRFSDIFSPSVSVVSPSAWV